MFTRGFALVPASAVLLWFTPDSVTAAEMQPSTPAPAVAGSPAPAASPFIPAEPKPERFSLHAQTTDVQQYHGGFPAAHSGPQSMSSEPDTAKTIDATLFLGARLGRQTELYVDPELDQGFGLGYPPASKGQPYNGTFGVAGFPSAEAYKIGRDASYGRIQRAFVRQTFNFGGGGAGAIQPDINQLGGSADPKHLILTAGKFSVVDVFDNNAYAHDPKNDFLSWSIVDMGAFDYPADAWGYTYGASAELSGQRTTARAGIFQLSAVPNQIEIEHQPLREYGTILELEGRTSLLGGHAGAVKGLVYADTGYMGSYADALVLAAQSKTTPSTAAVRDNKHVKVGAGINIAQEIAPNVGVFARVSAMNGTYEAYEFTEIDRSTSAGLSISGTLYHRPEDTFGLAGALNALSEPAKRYFAAGGLGVLIGDGTLSYGGERILETYYRLGISKNFGFTLDYQYITNPAYNAARGPISVYGLRYHAQM